MVKKRSLVMIVSPPGSEPSSSAMSLAASAGAPCRMAASWARPGPLPSASK
jgi:hypothetical protein